jgi:hypothetical protein
LVSTLAWMTADDTDSTALCKTIKKPLYCPVSAEQIKARRILQDSFPPVSRATYSIGTIVIRPRHMAETPPAQSRDATDFASTLTADLASPSRRRRTGLI